MRSQNRKVKMMEPGLTSVGKVSCLGLLGLGIMLACPICEHASALTPTELESGSLTSSVSIAFTPASGSTSLSPTTAAGASGLISVLANVGVTNSGGYSVYLGSNSTNLVGKNDPTNVIPGVSGEVSFANLQDNTWGYYAGEGTSIPETATYKAISQGQGDIILANNNSRVKNESKTIILSFAAKIDNNTPADTYENQVTLSVLSSPYQLTLLDIDNMQDMTTAICEHTPNLETKQLKDIRDGKYYWVTKLADNNCWMTQNLDLDLSTKVALTPDDSDVKADWTPGLDTVTEVTAETILVDNVGQRSWSLGDYRMRDNVAASGSDCGFGKNSAADCPEQFMAYTTPQEKDGVSPMLGDELAHYILGNHYQWNAATADTGGTITDGQATSSICPKGWRLPTSNTTEAGSFGGLVSAGGIGNNANKLTSAPYYFVRGGVAYQTEELLSYAGYLGLYWSSTPTDGIDAAYNLQFFSSASLNSSYDKESRRNGLSVRCVAR